MFEGHVPPSLRPAYNYVKDQGTTEAGMGYPGGLLDLWVISELLDRSIKLHARIAALETRREMLEEELHKRVVALDGLKVALAEMNAIVLGE